MVPSEAQKLVMKEQLAAMPHDQWTAIVRWIGDRIVSDDQSLAISVVTTEASRRMAKRNEYKKDENKEPLDVFFAEVCREVGFKLVCESK